MTGKRTGARRRTAIALVLSLAGHAAIFALLILDLDDGVGGPPAPPAVEVVLMDAPRRPPPDPREAAASPAQPSADQPAPRRTAMTGAPSPSGTGMAASGGAGESAAPQADASGIRFGCVGLRIKDKDERVDCILDRWATLDGRPARELGPAIPAEKLAEYAATARRQAAQRRPIAAMGNRSSMGCAHSNLGTGCVDDMAIPLLGSAAEP